MSKFLRAALAVAFLVSTAAVAQAQTVAMSGQYGERSGLVVPIPINILEGQPPGNKVQCGPDAGVFQIARCPKGHKNSMTPGGGALGYTMPRTGVKVEGAGVRIINGGLNVGDPFTIPGVAFKVLARHRYTPVIENASVHQLDTTLTAALPRTNRVVNPPPLTRRMSAMNWSNPNGGQTGRANADTGFTLPSVGVGAVQLNYTAGPNEFGGTMAALLDGDGRLYLKGFIFGSAAGSPATRPWAGTNGLGDGIQGNLNERNGAGWNYTIMNGQQAGVVKNNVGLAPECPGPFTLTPGCGLVTDFSGTVIGGVPPATSTKFMFPWTTGTAFALKLSSPGGFPNNELLTGMGYDTTSMTGGGGTVRNVGLVAGSYTRRTSPGATGPVTRPGTQMIGIDLQFTPEPGTTVALLGGLGLLGFLARRRS